jgi:hypothetical protein
MPYFTIASQVTAYEVSSARPFSLSLSLGKWCIIEVKISWYVLLKNNQT